MMNFDYLKDIPEVATLYRYCEAAERNQYADPEVSALNARRALEWIARAILTLKHEALPERCSLFDMVTSGGFTEFVNDEQLLRAVHYIRKIGNTGAHVGGVTRRESFFAVLNLYNFIGAVMLKLRVIESLEPFDKELLPQAPSLSIPTAEVNPATAKDFTERVEPEAVASASEVTPAITWDNISEAETRRRFIDLMLKEAGWEVLETEGDIQPGKAAIEVKVEGMPNNEGVGYADYVMFGPDRKPLAVVEAKRTSVNPVAGEHQAELYAAALEKKYGVCPVIYLTNGFKHYVIDRLGFPKREIAAFHSLEDLQVLHHRQGQADITDMQVKAEISGRYYQIAGIHALCDHFNRKHRKGLLVMATGTGKTRTAISLVELLMRSGRVKNVLFLADRTSLVKQARREFAKHLPNTECSDLTATEHNKNARILFSTYQTMINYVDAEEKPFSVGRFDLIIVDEAHRSIFDKFKAIFRYFDAMLVGLTATPRDQVNRSTYDIFELEQGEPNYAYEYQTAVDDGFLCPYRGLRYESEVLTNGIRYDELTAEEREQMEQIWEWEALQDAIDPEKEPEPRDISNSEIFKYVYNTSTIDNMLNELMAKGLMIESGEKIGKTIIFAMNREHAEKIVSRFNLLFPHLGPDFCKQIDYSIKYAQDLIEKFEVRGGLPQVVVSVDMLDTGIDVPDVLNLVFFKRVRSRIKFWQMIGRGTRLSADIFGPGKDKEEFYIFDWCGNFDYFGENPQGIEPVRTQSLTERLFGLRADIALLLQGAQYQEEGRWEKEWHDELKELLQGQLLRLNDSHISVREHWETVAYYRNRANWQVLTAVGVDDMKREIGPLLPTQGGNEAALKFDMLALYVQLSLLDDTFDAARYEGKITLIAGALKQLGTVPQVMTKIDVINEVLTPNFWENKSLPAIERMRLELRDLLQFLSGNSSRTFDVNIDDESTFKGEAGEINSTMTYRQKVLDFLAEHREMPVLRKIQNIEQLTSDDVDALERIFWEELGTKADYERFLKREQLDENIPIGGFIRKLQGVDRTKAIDIFAKFISVNQLTAEQEEYLEGILNYVCQNGDIEVEVLLTESPFDDADEEDIFPGKFHKVGEFVSLLHKSIVAA
ncbi:MAG: DEAD/DEAH box helicase family protein [Bacteroidales bacterium]|nr:DEAD/DEAH box helicase family protein [Bacteroidales bacterium]